MSAFPVEGVSILPREDGVVVTHPGCPETLSLRYQELWAEDEVVCACGQRLFSLTQLLAMIDAGLADGVASPHLEAFVRETRARLLGS